MDNDAIKKTVWTGWVRPAQVALPFLVAVDAFLSFDAIQKLIDGQLIGGDEGATALGIGALAMALLASALLVLLPQHAGKTLAQSAQGVADNGLPAKPVAIICIVSAVLIAFLVGAIRYVGEVDAITRAASATNELLSGGDDALGQTKAIMFAALSTLLCLVTSDLSLMVANATHTADYIERKATEQREKALRADIAKKGKALENTKAKASFDPNEQQRKKIEAEQARAAAGVKKESFWARAAKVALTCLIASAITIAVLSLTGCGSAPETEPVDVVVIAGEVQGSPAHNYATDVLDEALRRCIASDGKVDIIMPDGTPASILSNGAVDASTGKKNSAAAAQVADTIVKTVTTKCAEAGSMADSAEFDLLGALDVAARGTGHTGSPTEVYCFASWLTTAGPFNLAAHPEYLYCDPDEVASALAPNLPDLSLLTKVVVFDCGDVAGSQQAPTNFERDRLKALVEAVLTQAGVGEVGFIDSQHGSAEAVSPMPVTTVELEGRTGVGSVAAAPEPEPEPVPEPVVLTQEELGFVMNTADFLDPSSASVLLDGIASTLAANPGVTATVIGSCAVDNPAYVGGDGAYQLALSRAQAVAEGLTARGIDAGRITVGSVGDVGDDRVAHTWEYGTDGHFMEDVAKLNRRVVVFFD